MLSRTLSSDVKLDIELDQVPVLVNPSPRPDAPLAMRAQVLVRSPRPLEGRTVQCSLTGERITPSIEGQGVFGGSSPKNTERFLHQTQEFKIPKVEPQAGLFSCSIPLEFSLSPQLPGSLKPLGARSSSVRYFVAARLETGRFVGSVSSVKDVTIRRACRTDVEGLGSLVDTTTDFESGVSCTAWTPKSVLFGSRARIELSFRTLSPDVEVESVRVSLKERQSTSVTVAAAFQQRPGESKKIVDESEICCRAVEFPSIAADSNERPDTLIMDLALPRDEKYNRRTTSQRAGIEMQHFFDMSVVTNAGSIGLSCDTILSFSLEDDQAASLPPSYDESAPPNYYEHSLDELYNSQDGWRRREEGVLFLTTQPRHGVELSPAQEKMT